MNDDHFNNFNKLSDLTKSKYPIFNKRYNQYEICFNKSIDKYNNERFIKNKKRYLAFVSIFLISTLIIKAVKYYYVVYYYFMYDIDIRKPKVSDYFLQRYR